MAEIKNIPKVVAEINKNVKRVFKATKKGLIAAGLHIQGEAQRLCPVDTGNLKASGYTMWSDRSSSAPNNRRASGEERNKQMLEYMARQSDLNSRTKSGSDFKVEVGFVASYAIFVHGNSRQVRFKVGQEKFLQTAIQNNKVKIVEIIRRYSDE